VHQAVRVGAAGLAITFLTTGCAEEPQSVAAPPTGGAATSSTGAVVPFPEPEVTAQEAQATALNTVGGGWIAETKIEEGDHDRDGDDRDDDGDNDDFEAPVDVWEIRVVLPDGRRHQVSVDMSNGSVLDNRLDD
jgi:hypothetical protein